MATIITILSSRQFNQDASRAKIADLLAMPGVEDIELVIPPLRDLPQPAELSADDADDADKNRVGPPDLNSVNSPRL